LPEDLIDAENLRAVRVILGFSLGVVLSMHGNPFLGGHAGGHPQPETEEMTHDRMQVHSTVRLMAVQENGDTGDGNMGNNQGGGNVAPNR